MGLFQTSSRGNQFAEDNVCAVIVVVVVKVDGDGCCVVDSGHNDLGSGCNGSSNGVVVLVVAAKVVALDQCYHETFV